MRYHLSTDRRKRTLSDWPTLLTTGSICLLGWASGYLSASGLPLTTTHAVFPFWEKVFLWMDNQVFVYAIGLIFMLLTAYIIQRISDIQMLIRERTKLVFLIFILLTSTNSGLFPFKDVTVVSLCLVFMVNELFNTYQTPEATGRLFNAGVLIGVAGLFMPQALWFLPLLWIGMYQLMSLSYRSFFASLTGVLIIYWLVIAWCVWAHDFSIFTMLVARLADFEFLSVLKSFRYYQTGFIGVLLLMMTASFYIKSDAINNRVRVRQMLSFLLNMSVWSLVLLCLYGKDTDSFNAIFYIPASVLIAYFFESMRNRFRFIIYYFVLAFCVFSLIMRDY